jgi:hypothetical protein
MLVEQLGIFYLGKRFDAAARAVTSEQLMYDARHLTTHAVCVGMTGSGKSGLGLTLIEEAAIDGIPSIVIDPKGDLGNLLLAFPALRPADFAPWIDRDEAQRAGKSVDELATTTAERWRQGLAESDQGPERIALYKQAVDVTIYTPGSKAGVPLSVLGSLVGGGSSSGADDVDALRSRVSTAASGLLTLVGLDADPMQSREHMLVAAILESAARQGRPMDLAALIREVHQPPFTKVGVFELETFFPAKDRMALALRLNTVLAAPGFSAWTEGEPLDIKRLLHTPEGKPRVSVVSIAHLSDGERMFFVTKLLNEVIAWMRAQPGTSSLRALLYMDEIFGYFPPVAAPPSKLPMLTLLKQARAFGLGVVLATQNPVDLDYKGLANAGTWFIGRLQTERDKARLLDGLEGATAASGRSFDRARLDGMLSSLGKRVFLMNDVNESEPVLFQTRCTLSYLRGPLTPEQISTLTAGRREQTAATAATPTPAASMGQGGERPLLPPELKDLFLAPKPGTPGAITYRPAVFGSARLHYVAAKAAVDLWQPVVLLAPLGEDDATVSWDEATAYDAESLAIEKQPVEGARFLSMPGGASTPQVWTRWQKALQTHLYEARSLVLWRAPELKETSRLGESEADFRVRLGDAARTARDEGLEVLRRRWTPKITAAEERLRKAEERIAREEGQKREHTLDTALAWGGALLGVLAGRSAVSAANVGRVRTATRATARAVRESGDVASAQAQAEQAREQLATLNTEMQADLDRVKQTTDPSAIALERLELKPRKGDIVVGTLALAWTPWVVGADGLGRPAF